MTCRHAKGDPNCSATAGGYAQQRFEESARQDAQRKVDKVESRIAELIARTPNPDQYEVERHSQVGSHLVMMVQYSSCKSCSFDAKKVMVYLDVDVSAAMYWRSIDPHFDVDGSPSRKIAPPPRARFPADDAGWSDAIAFAESK